MSNKIWRVTPSRANPGWHIVLGPYDDDFREDIKKSIPPRHRTWKDGLRAWAIHDDALDVLNEVLERHSLGLPPAPMTLDNLRLRLCDFGTRESNAELWEILELAGRPVSVEVRGLNGQVVVLAVIEVEN